MQSPLHCCCLFTSTSWGILSGWPRQAEATEARVSHHVPSPCQQGLLRNLEQSPCHWPSVLPAETLLPKWWPEWCRVIGTYATGIHVRINHVKQSNIARAPSPTLSIVSVGRVGLPAILSQLQETNSTLIHELRCRSNWSASGPLHIFDALIRSAFQRWNYFYGLQY